MADDVVQIKTYISANWIAGSARKDVVEVPRAEWDAMTPEERQAYLDETAQTVLENSVEVSAYVEERDAYVKTLWRMTTTQGEDPMTTATTQTASLTREEASELRQQRDAYVKTLWRKPKSELAAIYRRELAARGQQLLYGGPASKDELTNAVVSLRYPAARLDEAIHVLHHGPGESWSACTWCHPHQGERCECGMAVQDQEG